MSRILLAWELGLNLGHLTRLLPVAERLKADGHSVLVATRNIEAAASVLGPAGIAFIPAPHLREGLPLAHRAAGYADILLSQGWSDVTALRDLDPLLDADLCITYGAEGTLLRFLLAGVPQLVSPWHVETFMATKRLEALRLGAALPNASTAASAASFIQTLAFDREMRDRALGFAKRTEIVPGDRGVAAVVAALSLDRAVSRHPPGAQAPDTTAMESRASYS